MNEKSGNPIVRPSSATNSGEHPIHGWINGFTSAWTESEMSSINDESIQTFVNAAKELGFAFGISTVKYGANRCKWTFYIATTTKSGDVAFKKKSFTVKEEMNEIKKSILEQIKSFNASISSSSSLVHLERSAA